jgi:hypothetical protein
MLNIVSESDTNSILKSNDYKFFDDVYSFENTVTQYPIDETGICFFDKDNNVVSMFKGEDPEETKITMKKVVAVCDLGEEEITKFDKVRHISKGFLEICFRKKISVFLLSVAFIYMNIMGIKEKFYIMNIMYTWGFFKITETGKAVRFIKETLEEYKLREEAMSDKDFMEFFESTMTDEVEDMKLYLTLKK